MSWYLRSTDDHDTHRGTISRGSVIAACGIRFASRTIAFGRKALLEDLDWGNAVVRVRARKTDRGALLPLPGGVGAALADYLQHGRPDTRARQVFVLHRLRVDKPISSSIVGRAVDNALRRAGMAAPMRGAGSPRPPRDRARQQCPDP